MFDRDKPKELKPSEGRVPPNDLDAEAAVISAVFNDPAMLDHASDVLRPEHFYSHPNRSLYEAQIELRSANRTPDALSVKGWLADRGRLESVGGLKYIVALQDTIPAVANVGEYAQRIVDKWRLREMIRACQTKAAEGYGEIEEVQEWIDGCEQAVFEIASVRTARKPQLIKAIMREHYVDIQERIKQQAAQRITTGLVDLDRQIVGMSAPNLVVLAGQPGTGKSSMLTLIARHVALRFGGVALFSLEMGREEVIDQMLCSEAKVDSRLMAKLELSKDQWTDITTASNSLHSLPLWIDDEPGINLVALRAKCRRISAECKALGTELRLVGIDYQQLMGVDAKATNREQEVAKNSRGLKLLAKDLGVPVIALSQLNRQAETRGAKNQRPRLNDLRESGAIGQDADIVVFIYHDEKDPEEVATIIVAKGRRFGAGDVKVLWRKVWTRFDNLENGDYSYAKDRDF